MNIIKKIYVILTISLLCVACGKDTPTPNNGNECANCLFNDFCLDSTKFEITDSNELFGTWRFKGFIDNECNLETSPDAELDSILISFSEDNEIKGFILPNVFEGVYKIDGTQILLSDIVSTEINEQYWSNKFSQTFFSVLNFATSEESLYISTTNDVMLFERISDMQINTCSNCSYETICLDTILYQNIQKIDLMK